jgi:hypothetical protein
LVCFFCFKGENMAEKFTGISLKDIKNARQQVAEQQLAHGEKMTSHPYAQWINSIPREAAKAHAETERLRVRRMVTDSLLQQGKLLIKDKKAPVFHPDVLSPDFDPQIASGELTPVISKLRKTKSGLEVPLYAIDARRGPASTPLGELIEEADPEHNPVKKVIDIIDHEGPAVVEQLGYDPELTSIQVVKAPDMITLFQTRALSSRETVTATPSKTFGEMVTVDGSKLGSHPAHENSVPTKLVLARFIPATSR